jgi:hypothetical protein
MTLREQQASPVLPAELSPFCGIASLFRWQYNASFGFAPPQFAVLRKFGRSSRQARNGEKAKGGLRMKTNFSRVMATMALRFRDNLALVNVERDRRYT